MGIHGKTEEEAIQVILETADRVLKQPALKRKCIELLTKVCTIVPNKQKQDEFIKNIGSNGAEVVAKILKDKWGLYLLENPERLHSMKDNGYRFASKFDIAFKAQEYLESYNIKAQKQVETWSENSKDLWEIIQNAK